MTPDDRRPVLFCFAPTSVEESPFLSVKQAFARVGGNTGNLAFVYAVDRQLGGGLRTLNWDAGHVRFNELSSIGVMPVANQLGLHCDMAHFAREFSLIKQPLVAIGLGAQADTLSQDDVSIPQGTLDWVRVVQEHAPSAGPNISLRGEFTRRVLERHGLAEKTIVLGCPSLFISPERHLGRTIAQRYAAGIERVGVAAGQRHWPRLRQIEASLTQMARTTGGTYFCQHNIEMVRLGRREARLLDPEVRESCRNYIAPDMSDTEFIRWCDRHAVSYFSAAAWMEEIRRHDFVVGPRIHGVMLALQVGVPALCVAHDSRTIELCEIMRVPYVKAEDVSQGIKRDDLQRLFQFDAEEFDRNRLDLAKKYVGYLEQNGLNPAGYLTDLTKESAEVRSYE